MQFQGQGKAPLGVVYNTTMSRADAALTLALLYGFEGKREARVAAVAVTGTASSGEFAGHSAAATLVFQPVGGPTACLKGVTAANFTGVEAPY